MAQPADAPSNISPAALRDSVAGASGRLAGQPRTRGGDGPSPPFFPATPTVVRASESRDAQCRHQPLPVPRQEQHLDLSER